jgi:ornithine cyclodeaminase/alanine dehydrogenase-like protein (mu-crystallin family)
MRKDDRIVKIMPMSTVAPGPVLLLGRETLSGLLSLDDCIAAVECAFAAHAQGTGLTPGLLHVDANGGEFHIKAGGIQRKQTYFVCKVNGGFFQNRARLGLPNIIGLILLCDGATGVPLAVLESGLVTQLRTGAATAVAARYLARRNSETVTICGAGNQAEFQLRALAHVLPLKRAWIWTRGNGAPFVERMRETLKIEVHSAAGLTRAARESDVVVTCTPAEHWFLGREHIGPGSFVAAVGADSPDKQELEPELLARCSVVCDLVEQCAQVGDLHHAIAAGLMTQDGIHGELGAVIVGKASKRRRDDEVFIFDSTGTALQDAAVCAAVYERAKLAGGGSSFAFWD